MVRPEDMTIGELEAELDRLEYERDTLSRNWMVEDSDDEWGQVNREIEHIARLLNRERQNAI